MAHWSYNGTHDLRNFRSFGAAEEGARRHDGSWCVRRSCGGSDNLPRQLFQHARLRSGEPAMREKDLGIWQTWSWSGWPIG